MHDDVTQALRRLLYDAQMAEAAGASPLAPRGSVEALEMVHRLGPHCPTDLVADHLLPWVAPCIAAAARSSDALLDALLRTVLGLVRFTHELRSEAAAAHEALRSSGTALRAGELARELAEAKQRVASVEQELAAMQETHLNACEAFLTKTSAHFRMMEAKEVEVSQLQRALETSVVRAEGAESEVSRLLGRLERDGRAHCDALLDETARSSALRRAWRRAEEERDEARVELRRSEVAQAAASLRCQLELAEADVRVRLAQQFAVDAAAWAALEPFRRSVAQCAKLRATLMARTVYV